ncbi:MAG: bifunctional [glutamate--ammonia ligase]-adenylyl-L-tyrosine phosphorylase/[glutamate--ammonia-ligase] adenylyltransferase, partial [Zoogloeaceae bacterium]|nr:bifunctional [glutamate--ammonia ligase]-adenylyl-L-tyrosine phosphorylase/[glutamate--ammonia-ligase] adenylyltransferase [Zoogloeaceae bacterium]
MPACDLSFALDLSAWLARQFEAHPALSAQITERLDSPVDFARLCADWPEDFADEAALKRALRQLRREVLAQLLCRDVLGLAPLAEVMETMTALAELAVNVALGWHHRQLVARYGEPLDHAGQPQKLMVLGMGKLGGRELNVSSDVDFIFAYPEDGQTEQGLDNFAFFTRLGKKLIDALDEPTADGQVFRVDMRLRPNGDSGPLVSSIAALEHYFIAQGRPWERFAWIKARCLNAGDNRQPQALAALQKTATPFVYRKYLDYVVISDMRQLHAQIRQEVARKDRVDHIKLGPGGIREIEFIAQVFQIIRGGRAPNLRVRATLDVLAQLAETGILPLKTDSELKTAYVFLRRLEHRLQYVDDQQTHRLPTEAEARRKIALSMGFADWAAFETVLSGHRAIVSKHFEEIFSDRQEGEEHPLAALWLGTMAHETRIAHWIGLDFADPEGTEARLEAFRQSGKYRQLPEESRQRIDAVGPQMIDFAHETARPDEAFARGLAFLETISRRAAYLALLFEQPQALKKVIGIVSGSAWAADYLNQHPVLLDELLDARLMDEATDWPRFRARLTRQLDLLKGDMEREMDAMREAHHAQVFRLLAQDLGGLHTVEQISDHLSALADGILEETIRRTWSHLKNRHRDTPAFAVIGYGKLGGKELGYGSDLDLVYLSDEGDDDPAAQQNYNRLGQRISTWLSTRTAAGMLFDTDLRLRPNGEAGVLVPTLAGFCEYEEKQAWVWEHQALTRARFVAGDMALGARFEAERRKILQRPRDPQALRAEVLAMRQKMREHKGDKDPARFDVKEDQGG